MLAVDRRVALVRCTEEKGNHDDTIDQRCLQGISINHVIVLTRPMRYVLRLRPKGVWLVEVVKGDKPRCHR